MSTKRPPASACWQSLLAVPLLLFVFVFPILHYETVWQTAEAFSDFRQREPDDGEPTSDTLTPSGAYQDAAMGTDGQYDLIPLGPDS
ncbi:MAG: hypothetical protein ABIF09_19375 [Gemmatimonadota bacterium]